MPEKPLERIEERIAWLERHVTEQDRAMFEMGEELARLRKEVASLLRQQLGSRNSEGEDLGPDERPPHY